MTTTSTNDFTFRFQTSIMDEVRKLVEEEGTTLDQFINAAVAEKLAALRQFAYFEERAKGADREAFREFLENGGGNEPPREGDELPEGWMSRRQARQLRQPKP